MLSPAHDRSDRDWNQRTLVVECALQNSRGRRDNLVADLSY
jgi:hypothetical protein